MTDLRRKHTPDLGSCIPTKWACQSGLRHRRLQESSEPACDQLLSLIHDAVDQVLHGRDVVDETGYHAATPCAGIHFAILHHARVYAGDLIDDVVELEIGSFFPLDADQLLDVCIGEDTLGIAQAAHDEARVELGGRHDGIFDVLMNRCFLCGHEASAHVHALGTQCKGCNQAAGVGHPPGSHEGDFQFLGSPRQQDHVRYVVLARVATAFESV